MQLTIEEDNKNTSIDFLNNIPFSDDENFELLIKDQNRIQKAKQDLQNSEPPVIQSQYGKAKGNASYEDFITMVKTLVAKALKKYKLQVLPGEGTKVYLGSHGKVEGPYIFFNLISRVPVSGTMAQPKPKLREQFVEKDDKGNVLHRGNIYGQLFDCIVQFNIAAADYETSCEVINAFEETMFKYTGYFKHNVVSDIFFIKQYEDDRMDPFRDKMSIRSLQYNVRLEKIFLMYDDTIQSINALG
jgi:hypothetical protein